MTKEKSNTVKSVLKAFAIIEELDKAGELSIGELSKRLSMDKSTVHRLINTIKEAGYVNQNEENRKYSNSLKLFAIGNKVVKSTGIKKIARPYLECLADKSGETINLGVRVGAKIIYVDKIESSSTIRAGLEIGMTVPTYCSGLGKAILAFTPEETLNEVLDEINIFKKYTKKTIENRADFLKELEVVRKNGYSIDDEEYVDGLICFGVPVFDYHGNPVAAVSISFPKYRYDELKHREMHSKLLLETSNEISKQLGYKSGDYNF
jgi:IclR family KDG regulon transcriptional repressor